jgi:adenine-specific DNA-methyltransferase
MSEVKLYCGNCMEVMAGIPDNSIDLIATDPPYYKVKGEWWDRQWDTPAAFLAWIGDLCDQWQRILRPNGSLYVFASPKMAARVECVIGERFNVLNTITWDKDTQSYAEKYGPQNFRQWVPISERIIFAEHYGADNIAKYNELKGFVFEPLRAYLAGERDRAGIDNATINAAWCEFKDVTCTSQTQKWFSQSCFNPPTREAYYWLRELFHKLNHGRKYFCREYENLRWEYEDLRREYEDLRRPFYATEDRPYTDVWTFPTVSYFQGKHPTEKPVELMEHIILTSSRPGAVVLDCFMGRGSTAIACQKTSREFIGIDIMDGWVKATEKRIAEAQLQIPMFTGMKT